ncbi:MAG TPA: hypothetical protein VG826_18455 [Pirellulales bacterium]|nr:hypothetical protein [Pirellulales bacterium]
MLLFRVAVDAGVAHDWWGANRGQLLTKAFLCAQFSAAVVWLILGSVSIEKKLWPAGAAVALLAATLLMTESYSAGARGELWDMVMFVQLVATVGLAALLCALGWQIVHLDASTMRLQGAWLQFSLRHLFVAMTGAGVVLVLYKAALAHLAGGADLLECMHVVLDGTMLAVASLAAVWAALGAGPAAARFSLLLLLAIVLGSFLWGAEATAEQIWTHAGRPMRGFGWRFRQAVAGGWWLAWTLLAAVFLASWLSVLRATGYRFVRRRIR